MITAEIYRKQLMAGMYSRIARQLKLKDSGRSHVRRVALGYRRSVKVEAALRKETIRIEKLVRAFMRKQERAA